MVIFIVLCLHKLSYLCSIVHRFYGQMHTFPYRTYIMTITTTTETAATTATPTMDPTAIPATAPDDRPLSDLLDFAVTVSTAITVDIVLSAAVVDIAVDDTGSSIVIFGSIPSPDPSPDTKDKQASLLYTYTYYTIRAKPAHYT